jgi:glyoxylase-like metal-dependent hydrolase (beta-lactamase superfamily II)
VLPAWLEPLSRTDPSAHGVLVRGAAGHLLVDPGWGSRPAVAELRARLAAAGVAPGDLALVAATHFHADHVGALAWLQAAHGTPAAAHAAEAALVNARDPRAADHDRMGHPVGPYTVQRPFLPGDVLGPPGGPELVVVDAAGQTPGHVALHAPEEGVLLTGDLLQDGDVAWVLLDGPEDLEPLRTLIRTVERLAALEARIVLPGHGPPVVRDVPRVVEATLRRYAGWLEDPPRALRHAGKRAVAFWLMTTWPPAREAEERMAAEPWLRAVARASHGGDCRAAAAVLLGELDRLGILARRGGRLGTSLPHLPPGPLEAGPGDPAAWPAARV